MTVQSSQHREQRRVDVSGDGAEQNLMNRAEAGMQSQAPIITTRAESRLVVEARAKRFRLDSPVSEAILGAVGIIGLLLVWELISRTGIISPKAVPPPSEVAVTAVDLLTRGEFWIATWDTLWATGVGMVVMIAIAVPLAIAIHSSRVVEESTWFIIEFLKPIPGVALIPLALLVWGPTDGIKIALIVFGGVWPLLTQLIYGLREISGVVLNMSKVYQFSAWQKFRYVTLPSLMPFALTGLRISITLALIIAIVTEYIVGINGIGLLLSMAQLNGLIHQTYAVLFFSGVLGLLASGLVTALNKPLLFWHPSQRDKRGH